MSALMDLHDFVAGLVKAIRYKPPDDVEVLECCIKIR